MPSCSLDYRPEQKRLLLILLQLAKYITCIHSDRVSTFRESYRLKTPAEGIIKRRTAFNHRSGNGFGYMFQQIPANQNIYVYTYIRLRLVGIGSRTFVVAVGLGQERTRNGQMNAQMAEMKTGDGYRWPANVWSALPQADAVRRQQQQQQQQRKNPC